jgi:hypothetical protein
MAERPGDNDAAEKLSEEIARSRSAVSRDVMGLRYELDFPRKLKRSFKSETMLWISAAIAVGVIIAVLPARTKKVEVEPRTGKKGSQKRLLEAGFVLGALKIAASFLRPVIVDLVRSRLAGLGAKPARPSKW